MIVVDTQAIIWHALKPAALSKKARETIRDADKLDGLIFCEISLWEIAMLMKKKRLKMDTDYMTFIDLLRSSTNYIFQGMTPEIADLSTQLPDNLGKDPADRIICATTIVLEAKLVTATRIYGDHEP